MAIGFGVSDGESFCLAGRAAAKPPNSASPIRMNDRWPRNAAFLVPSWRRPRPAMVLPRYYRHARPAPASLTHESVTFEWNADPTRHRPVDSQQDVTVEWQRA